MRRSHSVVAVMVTFLLAAHAVAVETRKTVTIDVRFVPQEGVSSNAPDLTSTLLDRSISLRLEDARDNDSASTIGQGTTDDDQLFLIRASSEVIPYVSDTLRQLATGWGVRMSEPADRVLVLRLTRFFVDESNKALGSVYSAEVKFSYTLTDRAGTKLIEGAASGSAHRYGRSRSDDNSNEVLSDALKEAFANVLSDRRVQEAWSSGRPWTERTGTGGDSIEERLRKVDQLFRDGLITKDEYERKRAEILKDV